MATNEKTNDLKKLIQTKLKTLTTNVYFEIAIDNALYPHIVFTFDNVNLDDLSRQDYILNVDIWDKGKSTTAVDDLTDKVESLLQAQNLPQTHVLPTFYLIDRKTIPDEDKQIQHRLVRFQIQNYTR